MFFITVSSMRIIILALWGLRHWKKIRFLKNFSKLNPIGVSISIWIHYELIKLITTEMVKVSLAAKFNLVSAVNVWSLLFITRVRAALSVLTLDAKLSPGAWSQTSLSSLSSRATLQLPRRGPGLQCPVNLSWIKRLLIVLTIAGENLLKAWLRVDQNIAGPAVDAIEMFTELKVCNRDHNPTICKIVEYTHFYGGI